MKQIILHFRKIKKSRPNLTTLMFFTFFFMTADAMLAYWLPGYLESSFGPAWMGIIIGFSSVIGILVDFFFPQIANHISIRRLLITANVSYVFYAVIILFLIGGSNRLIFLIPMAIWGIYYEMVSFANQEFVSEKIPEKEHQSTWVKLDFSKALAYLVGPAIVGYLVIKDDPYIILFTAICLSLIALLPTVKLWKKMKSRKNESDDLEEKIHFPKHGKDELKNWKTLASQAWPLASLHLTTIFADAIFWTGIAVLSAQISKTSSLGLWMFPVYILPTVLAPAFLEHQNSTPKTLKKMGSISLLMGLVFLMFALASNPLSYLILSFFLGLLMALILPMSEGLFTRFAVKLKKKQRHIIGFQGSLFSFPYIVGPLIYGFISQNFGHHMAFGVISAIIVTISLIVLSTGIKDIKIKTRNILDWKD